MSMHDSVSTVYYEPRWDLQGSPIQGVPITLAPGLGHDRLSARNCGNLPKCYRCHREIQRNERFHSVATQYVTKQPTGDISYDYVFGGSSSAARATFCEKCAGQIFGGK